MKLIADKWKWYHAEIQSMVGPKKGESTVVDIVARDTAMVRMSITTNYNGMAVLKGVYIQGTARQFYQKSKQDMPSLFEMEATPENESDLINRLGL